MPSSQYHNVYSNRISYPSTPWDWKICHPRQTPPIPPPLAVLKAVRTGSPMSRIWGWQSHVAWIVWDRSSDSSQIAHTRHCNRSHLSQAAVKGISEPPTSA